MRCLACGAEMQLVQVVQDTTMLVSGYEHHMWQCSECDEVERRFVFTREKTPAADVPVEPTHPDMPAAKLQTSAWEQALEKVRSRQTELNERASAATDAERHDAFNRDRTVSLHFVLHIHQGLSHQVARSLPSP
jgi:hypothetical protein